MKHSGAHFGRTFTTFLFIGAAFAAATVAMASPPVVKTVPWDGSNPLTPHVTYSSRSITLKGTCDQDGADLRWIWDFGDGSPAITGGIADKYAIEARHAYSGSARLVFTAQLTVTNTATGEAASKPYYVIIEDVTDPVNQLKAQVNVAIDEGLWYLHKSMVRSSSSGVDYGDWTSARYGGYASSVYYGITALNLNAIEASGGHVETGSPDDPYVETAQRATRNLFTWLVLQDIGPKTHGNPDSNGNGFGLMVNQTYPWYQGGMFMDAIIAGGNSNAVASTGPSGVIARRYKDIIQDMIDAYAWAQYDSSPGGGWRYVANQWPDNSACQWAAIGMIPAERTWDCIVPAWLKDWNIEWLKNTQDSSDGHFGYSDQDRFPTGTVWGPYATTPSGLVQLALDGLGRGQVLPGKTVSSWDLAETFLRNNFNNAAATGQPDVNATLAIKENYYGLFSFVKAMIYHNPPITILRSQTTGVPPIDWYGDLTDGLARKLVDDQTADGYWTGHTYYNLQYPMDTAMSVLMLNGAIERPPVAVATATPNPGVTNEVIILDGSASYHTDPSRKVDSWEWDINCDGTIDYSGPKVSATFSSPGTYCVKLRVTDDGTPERESATTITITIKPPPVAPSANPDGPYVFCPQSKPWFLNGSGSVNPDEGFGEPGAPGDTIVEYAWDLDGSLNFTNAFGPTPDVTAFFEAKGPGTNLVQLRVTDRTAAAYPSLHTNDLTSTRSTQVIVKGSNDVACSCLTLRASGETNSVLVEWTPNANAAFYIIYRSRNSGGPYDLVANSTNAQMTTYLDTNVVCLNTYYYVVEASANGSVICKSDEAAAVAACTNGCILVATCMPSVVANTDPGQCSATVSPQMVDGGSSNSCPDRAITRLTLDPRGPYPVGSTTVTLRVCDSSGACTNCQSTIQVVDSEAPRVAVRPAPNPSGGKIPVAGKNPGSGQNPDGYYELLAKDNCDANPLLYVRDSASSFVAGPFGNGDIVKITQDPTATPERKAMSGVVVAHLILNGDGLVYAVDSAGNASPPVNALVPPPPR